MSYGYLLDLAIILFLTKFFGVFTKRAKLPQVVGALIAGLIMGPSFLNIVHESEFIVQMAELGVVMLMFTAGLETDLNELKKTGIASLVIAIAGVVFPLIGGYLTYAFFYTGITDIVYDDILKNVFIGVVLTATSVSITVETLREMGKLQGKIGTAILGAAVIDDIIGIIVLTFVIGLKDTQSVSPSSVFLKTGAFFVFVAIVGIGIHFLFQYLDSKYFHMRRVPIFGLVFCLVMAYISEHFFDIADITGAYFAGIILCNMKNSPYISRKIDVTSYMIFSPVFFASIGISTVIEGMDMKMIFFTITLLLIAILSKIVGCGLGAKLCKFKAKESFIVGLGMISRGEVALIVAQKGAAAGLINPTMFPAVVIVVIVTTLITPVLLKLAFKGDKPKNPEGDDTFIININPS